MTNETPAIECIVKKERQIIHETAKCAGCHSVYKVPTALWQSDRDGDHFIRCENCVNSSGDASYVWRQKPLGYDSY